MNKVILTIVLSSLLFACGSAKLTEEQRMQNEIRRDIPFQLDSLKSINNDCWSFVSNSIITVEPDYEIRNNSSLWVYHTFFDGPKQAQQPNIVWRNLFIKKRKHRIICVDRVLKDKKTKGIIYILQSRNKSYASCGHYNWDVTRLEHLEIVGSILEDIKDLTLKRFDLSSNAPKLVSSDIKKPSSQDDYWRLIFHADSLYEQKHYDDAIHVYTEAFADDRYIFPSKLSSVAYKLRMVDKDEAAYKFDMHRIRMEKDYYQMPDSATVPSYEDEFDKRADIYNYDLSLKNHLEEMLERDQAYRTQWILSRQLHHEETQYDIALRLRADSIDSLNQVEIRQILKEHGFPKKTEVGTSACEAAWIIIQHAPLDVQKEYLPMLERAATEGNIQAALVAALHDRIDVREGRPQKYGTQRNHNGICPLLNKKMVNQWRKEVGLPPLDEYSK
ncbi:hypothetical protein J5A68_02505 [Prevotella melaninogenica]|uniref:DUF6624 domain-containing protein n=1 Tax=Prevotella melaninogenica TaxID=28132 RepID=UPI001BA6C9BB|nr:DUF6624 domain-containing protein [Prevotella melaninogenica]QUB68595.1 hypothetical protein J5A68_02505 [Prevotella melaninogenica]